MSAPAPTRRAPLELRARPEQRDRRPNGRNSRRRRFAGVEQRVAGLQPPLFGGERDQLHRLARQEAERARAREPSDVVVERHSGRPPGRRRRHELVAAAFGDEELRFGRIVLDLLPQAINMRLERVRRHVGVVAPDVLEQRLARHRLLFGAMQIAQDRGLLLGQPKLDAMRVRRGSSTSAGRCKGRPGTPRPRSPRIDEAASGCGRAARRSGTACRHSRWRPKSSPITASASESCAVSMMIGRRYPHGACASPLRGRRGPADQRP